MALPILPLMGLGSAISGLFSGARRRREAKALYNEQKGIADQQLGYANQVGNLVRDLNTRNPSFTDAFGGGAFYDPATGTWTSRLSPRDRAIQDASDAEEYQRLTGDQALARRGLYGAENIRQGAEGAAGNFLDDILGMRQGIGTVNADDVTRELIQRRTDAVNAGANEVQRGIRAISTRTGADDTARMRRLMQLRAEEIARTMGTPWIEGISIADQLNQARNQAALNNYNVFSGIGRQPVDRGFTPSDRMLNNTNLQLAARQMQNENTGLAGNMAMAASGIAGDAGNRLLRARGVKLGETGTNNVGNFLGAIGNIFNPGPQKKIG